MLDVRSNPSEAVESVLNQFGNDILRLAFSYLKTKEDAEDVVQETLIRFMQCGIAFENEQKVKAWLLHVAANRCKDILKSAAWKKQVAMPEGYDIAAEEEIEGHGEIVEKVLALPEKYRSVIHLFYYEEYSTKEIAEILEKKESTIRSLLRRARRMIGEQLGDEYQRERRDLS